MRIAKILLHSLVGLSMIIYMVSPIVPLLNARTASAATLGIPETINYQGRLKALNGAVVSDGSFIFEFNLYDASTGGTLVVDGSEATLAVEDGYFSTTINLAGTTSDALNNLWLEVMVGTVSGSLETMSTRVKLGTAAYSLVTRAIENAASAPATDLYNGRVYFNTATGKLNVYNGSAWVAVANTLDDAYNNFGSDAQVITVDDAVTGISFDVAAAGNFDIDLQSTGDFVIQDAGTAWATFTDAQALTVNGTGAIGLDSDLASHFKTSVGDLTLEAETGSLVLKGDEAAADAIYLDANDAAGTGITMVTGATAGYSLSGGPFDVSSTGILNLYGGGAATFGTTAGDVTLSADAGSLILHGDENVADAIQVVAAAGGIDISASGSAGEDIDITATGSSINLVSTEAQLDAIRLDADATTGSGIQIDAYDSVTNTTGKIQLDAGSGGIDMNSSGNITLDTTDGDVTLTAGGSGKNVEIASSLSNVNIQTSSSSKFINIGTTAYARTINIGTSTQADTINIGSDISTTDILQIGNIGNATQVDLHAGTGGLDIVTTGTTSDALDIDVTGVGGGMDVDVVGAIAIDSSSAGISLDGVTASNFTVTGASQDLTLSSVGGSVGIAASEAAADAITINASAGGMDLTAATFDLDLVASTTDVNITGNVNVDLAATTEDVTIGSGDDVILTVGDDYVAGVTGIWDINVTEAVTIDSSSAGISLDGVTASNFTVTGASQDLTLSSVGGSVGIAASEAAADAITINASTGGVDITAATNDLDLLASTLDVNITGNVNVDLLATTEDVTIGSGDDVILTVGDDYVAGVTGIWDINATEAATIDSSSAGISLDGVTASNFTVTGASQDLTLSSAGGSVGIAASEAAADSITIFANAEGGAVVIRGGDNADASSADGNDVYIGAEDDVIIDANDDFSLTANDLVLTGTETTALNATNEGLTISATDTDADGGGTITITGNDGVTATATTGTLALAATAAGVTIGSGTSTTITTGTTFDVDATGAVGIDSDAGLTLGGATVAIAADGGAVDIDSSTNAITTNATTLTADAALEIVTTGDFVIDSSADVVIDGTTQKLEFGSAGSGEHIVGDGTDLTIASGALINLTATTDVVLPVSVGMIFGDGGEKIESDNTDLTINSGVDINLTATADVNLPSNVGMTFGDDGEKIEGNGTDLTIASSNLLNLTATTDVVLPVSVGMIFGDGGEKIESDNTDLTITSGGDLLVTLTGGNFMPSADDGAALGASGTEWSDLFLNTGAVVNFEAGDVTLTHSANTLTLDGGTFAFGANALDGTYFDVAATTGAVTLTQQAVGTSPMTITAIDNATAAGIDLNAHSVSGNLIDVDYVAETQTGAISAVDIDLTNLTNDNANNLYGIMLNDFTSAGAGGNLYGIYQQGTNWDYGIYADDDVYFALDATVLGGDITGANGNAIDIGEAVDGTMTFSRDDAGAITLTAVDNDATAAITLDAGGAADVTIGSADVTQINLITDAASATDVNVTGSMTLSGDLTVSGGDITSAATTNLLNVTSTTINFASAATALNIADTTTDGTIDIGGVTSNNVSTINIATEGTQADAITIGNTTAGTTTLLNGGDASAINFTDFDVAATGATTITPDSNVTALTVTGTNITTSPVIDMNLSALTTGSVFDVDVDTTDITGFTNILDISDSRNHDDLAPDSYFGIMYDRSGNIPGNSSSTTTLVQLEYNGTIGGSGANGTTNGVVIDYSGATKTAGTINGLYIPNITGEAATETAINIGSGWDTGINLIAGAANTALNIDGGTNDQTTDLVTIDLDVNSAVVDGIYLDADVGTALSGGERMNAINIEVTGLAGDDASSNLTGIQLTGDTTSAGTVTGIVLGGSWDIGLNVLSDNLKSITFSDPGDFAMGHADNIYVSHTPGLFHGVKFDIDTDDEIFNFETDDTAGTYNMLFGPGNIDDVEAGEADLSGLVFLIAETAGTPDDLFAVSETGATFSDAAHTATADFAEYMLDSAQDLQAGELVSVDVNNAHAVIRTTVATDSNLMGIVSTDPGFIANAPYGRQADEAYAPIAFMGQVPVKVNTDNGAIAIGDYITSSSIPGVGMKADAGDPTVAIALETDADGDGIILSLVSRNNGYSLQGSSSALTAVSSDSLEVTGDASFGGSVTVAEHLYGSRDMAGRARMAAGHDYVHVDFEEPYESIPVITFSNRSDAEATAGYQYWVGDESETGFTIYASGWNSFEREFSWIAMGVTEGVVTISDGTTEEFDGSVTVASTPEESAPAAEEVVEEVAEEVTEPAAEEVVEEVAEEVTEPAAEEVVE